ncbi:Putative transmembrane protein ORF57 [Toxocara canis]|uniref:Chloride channel CLIC-like protein 1 n=1 Tax=Toxocara canis TaxID=6265 RepID=A0A0B2W2D6_TOXCA|nr:Putative transmembrane protein ORF57 [Toxocara canis]
MFIFIHSFPLVSLDRSIVCFNNFFFFFTKFFSTFFKRNRQFRLKPLYDRNMMFVSSLVSAIVLCGAFAVENVDIDLTVDRSDWKDPLDPFTSYHTHQHNAEQLATCEKMLQRCQQNNNEVQESFMKTIDQVGEQSDPTLKLIIRNMLTRLNVDIEKVSYVDRLASVYLNADDLATIRRYLNSVDDSISLREQIRIILEGFIIQQDSYAEPSFAVRFGSAISPYLPLLNLALLIPAVVIVLSSRHSSRSIFFLVFSTAFLASLFTVYNRKYQENVAARIARSKMAIIDHCKPKSLLSEALNAISGLLFIKGKSECLQYHEDLFVDPLYEISPLDVVCDVISNFIFTPLGIFGRHFNVFFNEFYRDSPIPLVIVKTILFIFLTISILFWACGYRLRTIFATLEPAGVAYSLRRLSDSLSTPIAVEEHKHFAAATPQRPIEARTEEAVRTPSTSMSCRSRFVRRDHRRSDSPRRSQSVGRMQL